ncbi:hypothetical protein RD792_003058 [Penstemon davidsonii]|uniref:NADP-dependent oxidoreductase domain-containing protein n=1 Tax=Penstemon davidsonii TaxID=160366 RepID=A0ABR0DSP7_9LAMI|nr:hypothetical protein RD792_003058 [Penstemon davidsonii]
MGEILKNSWTPFTVNSMKRRVVEKSKVVASQFRCSLTDNNKQRMEVRNGKDSLDICRVVNDGPAEDLYGIFINRVRRERPPEYLENVRGLTKWVPPPVKMTNSFVRESINVSLKRMDVSSLDMLQFHWWDYANTGYLDALKHLTDLKEEGKIKTVALTNFDTLRLEKILENGIPVVQHSIVDMRPQQKMAELCKLTGVKLITYGTVMGGLLSEKFLDTNLSIPFAGPPLNTPSLQKYKRMVDAWGGWSLFQVLLQTLKTVASKHGVSIPTVAVRFILDQQAVAGSMIGVRLGLSEHIKDANAIFSLVLDEDDIDSILEVSKKDKMNGSDYRRTDRRDNRISKKQKLIQNAEEQLESKLGFDLFTEGDKRLGWLLTFASSSLENQETRKAYSCIDLYFVCQDGSTFKAKYKFRPYFYVATKSKMEMEVDAYLRRRYEGQIADIEIVDKEDLALVKKL